MKKLKSGLIIFLCLIMVVSAGLVGCGEDDTAKPSETGSGSTDENNTEAEYYIPEKKYDDEEITILCPTADGEWTCYDFYEETSSDEPVPNAVFERKVKIEETFGVKIRIVDGVTRADTEGMTKKAHDAGLIEYDIIMTPIPLAYKLAQGGYIMNIENMGDYIDFSHDAWDQSFLSQTSIGDNNFFATGEITTMDNDGTWVMMFNKELAESYDIRPADIYQSVIDGDWTIDKLLEYTAGFYTDLNNNGELDHEDKYAIASTKDLVQGLFYGADAHIITKDKDDIPVLNFNNSRNSDIIDKIIQIFYRSNKITFNHHDVVGVVNWASQTMFEENRALFYSEVMQCAIRLREMDTEFGIIPMPKYNKEQKNYTTHVVALTALATTFPKLLEDETNANRRDMIAMVTQALAVEGKNILTPAYYEKSLMYKGARDDESRAMLPIIFANRICDIGYMAEGTPITSMHGEMMGMIMDDGENRIASVNEANERRVTLALGKVVDKFTE